MNVMELDNNQQLDKDLHLRFVGFLDLRLYTESNKRMKIENIIKQKLMFF